MSGEMKTYLGGFQVASKPIRFYNTYVNTLIFLNTSLKPLNVLKPYNSRIPLPSPTGTVSFLVSEKVEEKRGDKLFEDNSLKKMNRRKKEIKISRWRKCEEQYNRLKNALNGSRDEIHQGMIGAVQMKRMKASTHCTMKMILATTN